MTQENTSPKWLKTVSIIALIWNLLGVLAFISQMAMTPEMLAQLPESEQVLYQNTPIWATLAFALAVFAGTLGCVLLLLKRTLATPVFIASLMGIVVQDIHAFVVVDSIAVYGISAIIMPAVVLVIAFSLLILSNKAKQNGWLV